MIAQVFTDVKLLNGPIFISQLHVNIFKELVKVLLQKLLRIQEIN